MNGYILLLTAILFGVTGQLLLKQGMSKRLGFRISDVRFLLFDPMVVGGFFSYGVSTLLYLKALASLDLSLAYPSVSLGYVVVVILSKVLFKESVSPSRWAAVAIICTGIALIGFGGR